MSILIACTLLGVGLWGIQRTQARSLAQSGAPPFIHYQGLLTNNDGSPMTGTVSLRFSTWTAASGGEKKWEEDHVNVPLQEGQFTLLLGSNTALSADVFDETELWLEVSVNGGAALPRQRLVSVPYAIQAEEAKHATSASSAATALTASVAVTTAQAPWSGLTGKPSGLDDGDDDTLAALSCANNEIAKWNGSIWFCASHSVNDGDITEVNAGAGLSGGGTTGPVTLTVRFSGSGASDNAARADHGHDERYYTETELESSGSASVHWDNLTSVPAGFADGTDDGSQYENVIVVAKSGGDFTSILDAIQSITTNSASNRFLIWIAPGTYTEQIFMKQFVDIQGAGELLTKITAAGSSSVTDATLQGASNSELRHLTVENTGGDANAIAIRNNGASPSGGSPRLTHVTAIASGGTTINYAIINVSSAAPAMNYIMATASGGPTNRGIFNSNDAAPTMNHVIATASGGTDNSSIYNFQSLATIRNSIMRASGGSGNNYGIRNFASNGVHTVTVQHSEIAGTTAAILNNNLFTTLVAASLLEGETSAGGGTLTCAGVYTQSFNFIAGPDCP